MNALLQDLRYAIRSLRRTPGFAFTVIVVMALGIGVNSFIFSAVRGILFADLPFAAPERIYKIEELNPRHRGERCEMSRPEVRHLTARAHPLRGVAVGPGWGAFVPAGEEPQRHQAT